jgi:hypothetical protein
VAHLRRVRGSGGTVCADISHPLILSFSQREKGLSFRW